MANEHVGRTKATATKTLYAVHYPFMSLLFFRLGFDGNLLPMQTVFDHWRLALLPVVFAPVLAWLLMKYYDKPLRRWLAAHLD